MRGFATCACAQFISATDMIRNMKQNVESMEVGAGQSTGSVGNDRTRAPTPARTPR